MHMLTRPMVIRLHMIHVHIPIHPMHLTARAIMRPTTLTGIIPSVKAGRSQTTYVKNVPPSN